MKWQILLFGASFLGVVAAVSLINKPKAPPQETNMYACPPTNPFKQAVAATGLVEAYGENIFLGVPVEGLVQEVYVRVGDRVSAGDLLLKLDDRLQRAQVALQEQNVKVAKATLEKNISQLSRLSSVGDVGAVSVEDLRNKQYDVKIAKANLASAEASLHDALVALELTKILAPKDGVILRFDLRKGEFANFVPIDPVDNTTSPVVLGQTNVLQIRADIDEQNAYRIRPNQEAVAYTRGTLLKQIAIKFHHIEPYCIPKRNLSSVNDERIDTRVLQVIYTFEPDDTYPVYVGQQVDIYIRAPVGVAQ